MGLTDSRLTAILQLQHLLRLQVVQERDLPRESSKVYGATSQSSDQPTGTCDEATAWVNSATG